MKTKKINFTDSYLEEIATRTDFTTYNYKLLLLLAVRPMTQAQIAETLGVKRQNINKYVSDLLKAELLVVDRIEGKNKFLKSVTTLPKQENNPAQLTF